MSIGLVRAPEGFERTLGPLPDGVELKHDLRRNDRVDLAVDFVTERKSLEREIGWLVKTLPVGGALWAAWPKRASKVATDMTDDVVRELALPMGWVDVKVCAIDDIWTGLKLMLRKVLRPTA